MTAIAPYLSAYLRDHLPRERGASPRTCETYAYAFQLFIDFVARQQKCLPSKLELESLDAPMVLAFLDHLEKNRGNSPRTRNARLAAINAFFRFLEYRLPSCLDQARQIHALPQKKTDDRLVDYMTKAEIQALLDAPNPSALIGIRDRAMLHLAFAAGLRVSELIGLDLDEIQIKPHPTIHVHGKGRRERVLPLWKETATALQSWLSVRFLSQSSRLFLNARGRPMTRSGFEYILAKHVEVACLKQPSLEKKRISPHVLRHSCAMHTLQATRDIRKVALWLGHTSLQSTEVYLRADPTEKLEALAGGTSPVLKRGHFREPDELMRLLDSVKKDARYAE